MTTKLTSLTSGFKTQEQVDSYDRWFLANVQTALDDPHPGIPHDDAMEKLEAMLEEKRSSRAKRTKT